MTLLFTLAKPLLHQLEPEAAHRLAIRALSNNWLPPVPTVEHSALKQQLFGFEFRNPVGLAAGFDKNAEAVAGLAHQGFGFVEIGTVTPKPQPGNPTPRIFRLREDKAIINRLGFNNDGAELVHQRLAALPKQPVVIGVNIGRNKECADPIADYQTLITQMADVADYITINISSPNTQGLRDLQQQHHLTELLTAVTTTRDEVTAAGQFRLPLLLKIAPDIDQATKESIAELALSFKLDGLIISNTTIKRPNTLQSAKHSEIGGLSGKPLMAVSTKLLAEIYQLTSGKLPLIGVGGIASADGAYEKILAGASLVQLYTAFVYQGFGLTRKINQGLVKRLEKDGLKHITEAIGQAAS